MPDSFQDGTADAVSHCQALQQPMSRRPRAEQRWRTTRFTRHSFRLLFVTVLSLITLSLPPAVSALAVPEKSPAFSDQAAILYDHRAPPPTPMRLDRRADKYIVSPTTVLVASTNHVAQKAAATANALSVDSSQQPSSALPSPFDTTLGNNFTAPSCPLFFNNFLSNASFTACLPFSLLLQTSSGFFSATRQPSLLSATLDATCNVNVTRCGNVMDSLANAIKDNANCGADLEAQNPIVQQAYNGLVAYRPLYQAACLKNSQTGDYCYLDAATNASSPTASYIYYLPLGVALPASTKPICSSCVQNTMAVFAMAAGNATQPISGDYTAAASQIDQSCGDSFVKASVPLSSAASIRFDALSSLAGGYASVALTAALSLVLVL